MEVSVIKKAILKFITEEKFENRHGEKLRGFFSNLYREEDFFHNHLEGDRVAYRFPKIQYKVIDGNLGLIGIDEGAELIKEKFLDIKEIKIGEKIIRNFETKFSIIEEAVFVDDNLHKYKFITPWLSINQKNHNDYVNNSLNLDTVLRNNILSNLKGLGVFADKKIMVMGNYIPIDVLVKNISIVGFYGDFVTNVKLPDYVGVGKRKSIGFGGIIGV